MQLGEAIEAARRQKGWSQQQLAKKVGVGQTAVSRWETGTKFPSRKAFPLLAAVLELDLNELLRLAFAPDSAKSETLEASA
jgi:transcriptional regulator with XRE-family HTH domain